jgi:hemerythrin-like metal-binding protein
MEKITWVPSLSVGVAEIDRQHKQLIAMDGTTVSSETVSGVLTDMTEYADYHFGSEEKHMQAYGYPDLEVHKNQHAEFIRKTAEFSLATMAYKETIPTEILSYLRDWLVEHIMKADMQYKPFFEEKGLS